MHVRLVGWQAVQTLFCALHARQDVVASSSCVLRGGEEPYGDDETCVFVGIEKSIWD